MTISEARPRVGTAAWNIPQGVRDRFAAEGTLLQRYSQRFNAVEINSSFYRAHLPATYRRWATETPEDFRFSVKLPRRITHELQLRNVVDELKEFLGAVSELGGKLGVILIQLPPKLTFDSEIATTFLATYRDATLNPTACEPRHASWFTEEVETLFRQHEIARVAADPAPVPAAAEPGGSPKLVYFRLHGSPKMYYSDYSDESLKSLRDRLARFARDADTWCVFDNTAEGHATQNALTLTSPPRAT